LPATKTLEQFDFSFQPSLDERKIRDLHTLRFLANGENVIFLGPPGCGKTHLSITLGYAAITAGELVHFTTARDLFAKLRSSEGNAANFRRFAAKRAKLLIIDEIGYEPVDQIAAAHFFRLVCERYEHGSIILTSNKRLQRLGRPHRRRDPGKRDPRSATASRNDHQHQWSELSAQGETPRRHPRSAKRKGGDAA
jgi:DNA replication protein DnaC